MGGKRSLPMVRRSAPALALAILGAACAALPEPRAARPGGLPSGATLSPGGYLTIREVPASPFPESPPPEPTVIDEFARATSDPDPAVRARAWEEANGSEAFQAELQRLLQVLPQRETGNYVSARIVRDPGVAAEIWFKRDAAATLAQYTSDPLFRPREGGRTVAELQAIANPWFDRLQKAGASFTGSLNPFEGRVEISMGMTEAEFAALAGRGGWPEAPAEVTFTFVPPQQAPLLEASLQKLVRVFPRSAQADGIVLTSLTTGRIELVDGCFRLAGTDKLVSFARDVQLDLDSEGYVVVRSGDSVARIGEMAAWGGYSAPAEDEPGIRELRRQCGRGEIAPVGEPESYRLFSLPYPLWVKDYADTRGIGYQAAWDEVIACMKRQERAGRTGLAMRDRCIRQYNAR